MSAWVPAFVYRNYLTATGVSITPSSEASGMDADNLAVDSPSKKWRATTLSSLSLTVVGGGTAREWDVVWLGYTNLTPKLNLLKKSHTLDDASWVLDGTGITENNTLDIAPLTAHAYRLTASGAGSITHGISQTWTPNITTKTAQQYTAAFYVNDSETTPNPDGVELALVTNSGATVSVQLDFATDAVGSITYGSGWSDGVASVEAVEVGSVTSYRVALTATQANAVTTLALRVRMVVAGSTSFSQSGEEFYMAQCFMAQGDSSAVEYETTTERAAGLKLEAISSTTEVMSEFYPAMVRDMTALKDDRGWVHAVAYVHPSVRTDITWKLYISDEDNLDTYVEAGNLVIGKSFKPTGALVGGSATHKGAMPAIRRTWEAGRWVYEIDFDYVAAETAEREFMDMYQYANKADRGEPSIVAAGGQRFSRRRGVLFIADTGAGASEPERVIYGELLGAAPIISTQAGKYRVTVRIGELLP